MNLRAAFALALLAGCDGNPSVLQQPDLSPGVDDGGAPSPPDLATTRLPSRDPASHPMFPQLTKGPGPVLGSVQMYTVVYAGDEALGAEADHLHAWMLQSEYWTGSLGEYGVGAGAAKGVLVLPMAAPKTLDDSTISTLIDSNIASHAWPAPDATTGYAFVLPPTILTTMQGGTGCTDYLGYHSETSGGHPYSVNLGCGKPGAPVFDDDLSNTLSHEAAEMATDPFPFSNSGWYAETLSLGEVADICTTAAIYYDVPAGGGLPARRYQVTRLYSTVIAKRGDGDPCVPAPHGLPYFNVGTEPPVIPLHLSVIGGETQVQLELFAFGEVGLIKWSIYGQPGTGIEVSPDHGQGYAGDTFLMDINATKMAQTGSYSLDLYCASSRGGSHDWSSTIEVR